MIDTIRTHRSEEEFTTPPVTHGPYFFIGTASGKILRFLLQDGLLDSTYAYTNSIASFTVLSPENLRVIEEPDTETAIPPIVVDLNSDGIFETITIPSADIMLISNTMESKTYPLDRPMVSQPSFADLDNDGTFEIFFNSDEKLYAYNFNGSLVTNFPLTPVLQTEEILTGTPLVFDLDGDKKNDILIVTSQGQVLAFDRNGNLLPGFPTSLGGNISATSVAEDFDNDDMVELLSMTDNGQLYSWQLKARKSETKLWWNQVNLNPSFNNFIAEKLTQIPAEISSLMPEASVYNYPNPNIQDFTTIRYFLKDDAKVNIKIFDLAGDLVTNFEGPGLGNIHNEQRWELSDVSSGIYLCRVEASSADEKSVKIFKIMVVK